MLTLTRVTQVSFACPAQWDAWDADGSYFYLRYRYGHGQVRQYASADSDEVIAVIADFRHGHPLDGAISLEEFAGLAGITIAQDAAVTEFGDYLRDGLIFEGLVSPPAPEENA